MPNAPEASASPPSSSAASASLDSIRRIPEPQFRRQLADWMRTTEVTQRLQSKLRRDLFESFNATTLGRQIAAAQSGRPQLIASPLLLALNTLAAEFLYSQNCQFTLSVLATESPHPHTMPDFGTVPAPFRFGPKQVHRLLATMGPGAERVAEQVATTYSSQAEPGDDCANASLLFRLCEALIGRPTGSQRETAAQTEWCKDQRPNKTPPEDLHSSQQSSASSVQRSRQAHLRLLTAHVLRIGECLEDFRPDGSAADFQPQADKLRQRLLRWRRAKPRVSGRMRPLARAVLRLSRRLERCLQLIQGHSENTAQAQRTTSESPVAELSYSDWVLQLRHSRHGRRFLEHLRQHHRRVWELEAERQRTEWELKFQQERRLLKMHYKQRLLARYRELLDGGGERAAGGGVWSGAEQGTSNEGMRRDASGEATRDDRRTMEGGRGGQSVDAAVGTDRGEQRRVAKRSELISHLNLSNHKLPVINITPDYHSTTTKIPPSAIHTCSNHLGLPSSTATTTAIISEATRQRCEQLEAAAAAIDQSWQHRVAQHTEQRLKISEQQQRIQQQSLFGKRLLGAGGGGGGGGAVVSGGAGARLGMVDSIHRKRERSKRQVAAVALSAENAQEADEEQLVVDVESTVVAAVENKDDDEAG